MKKTYIYFSSYPNSEDWAIHGNIDDIIVFKSTFSDDEFIFGVMHEDDEDGCPLGVISRVDKYETSIYTGSIGISCAITDGTVDIYKYFLSLGYKILGNEIQYHNERLLWAKLSKDATLKVDIIDLDTNTTIEENVIIHQGIEDADFDERVWSYTPEKKDIRLILTDIK